MITGMPRRRSALVLAALAAGAAGGLLLYAVDTLVLDGDGTAALLVGGVCLWGAAVLALVLGLRARRATAAGGAIEVSTRLVSGRQDGVGPRWRAGTVAGGPGGLLLTPLRGGLRFLPGTPVTLTVDAAHVTPGRTSGRDVWSVRPGLPVVEVRTPTAVLQLAVPAGSEQRLVLLARAAG